MPMNIVYVMADDLGYNDCGFTGSADCDTPEIDALAGDACILNRFHTHPECTPSRVSMHTGVHPHKMGLSDDVIRVNQPDVSIPLGRILLSQRLKAAGYYTAMIGKWHLGHGAPAMLPSNRGFDYFYGTTIGAVDYNDQTRNGERNWFLNASPSSDTGYVTTMIGDKAVSLINSHNFATPLFLNINFTAPHTPLQALSADEALFPSLSGTRKTFAAMVWAMDREIGRIHDALVARGQWNNTVFVFMTDNGGDEDNAGDNGIYRGEKSQLYNGGVLGPAFIRWPGQSLPASSSVLCHIIDLHKTALVVAGAVGVPSDGENLLPLLKGDVLRRWMLVHCDSHSIALYTGAAEAHGTASQAARFAPGGYKFIVNPTRIYEGSIPTAIEAYAIADASEATDVSGSLDLTAIQKVISDIRAQRTYPVVFRGGVGDPMSYEPPSQWVFGT